MCGGDCSRLDSRSIEETKESRNESQREGKREKEGREKIGEGERGRGRNRRNVASAYCFLGSVLVHINCNGSAQDQEPSRTRCVVTMGACLTSSRLVLVEVGC